MYHSHCIYVSRTRRLHVAAVLRKCYTQVTTAAHLNYFNHHYPSTYMQASWSVNLVRTKAIDISMIVYKLDLVARKSLAATARAAASLIRLRPRTEMYARDVVVVSAEN